MITGIPKINQSYKFFLRYKEILFIFIRYGFSDWLSRSRIYSYFPDDYKKAKPKIKLKLEEYTTCERIRMVIEELGPTFIKLGQLLSNRPEIIPPELINELVKLQEDTPPFSSKLVHELIRNELGDETNNIFKKFSDTPIASASIAQVHVAYLQNGEKIALKLQRPGIKKQIKTDLAVMEHLAQVLERNIPVIKAINPIPIIKEFRHNICKEIDFAVELSHIKRFFINFKNDNKIYIPKTYKEYSTKKILALEYIDGISVGKTEELRKSGINPSKIAEKGTKLMLSQIFEHGFFHADPHPGNIFIMRDEKICFLDFGMMGVILPQYKKNLGDIIIGFVNNDIQKIAKTIINLSIYHEPLDMGIFEGKIAELIEQYTYLPLKDINIGEVISKSFEIVINYKIQMPPAIYLLVKALITIEGVARSLDPDFNVILQFKPFAKKMMLERLNPKELLKSNYFAMLELSNLFNELPFVISETLNSLKTGKFAVTIDEKNVCKKSHTYEQMFLYLSLSIIISALLIVAAYIHVHQTGPLINKIPIISLIAYLLALVGLIRFFMYFRKRK